MKMEDQIRAYVIDHNQIKEVKKLYNKDIKVFNQFANI